MAFNTIGWNTFWGKGGFFFSKCDSFFKSPKKILKFRFPNEFHYLKKSTLNEYFLVFDMFTLVFTMIWMSILTKMRQFCVLVIFNLRQTTILISSKTKFHENQNTNSEIILLDCENKLNRSINYLCSNKLDRTPLLEFWSMPKREKKCEVRGHSQNTLKRQGR